MTCGDDWQSVHVSPEWSHRAALMLHGQFWKLYCGYIRESLFLGNTSRYLGLKSHSVCNLISNSYQKKKKKITPFLYLITTSICLCLLSRERRQTCQMLLIPEPELQGHENFFWPISCNSSARKHEIVSKGKRQETVIPFWSGSGDLRWGNLSSTMSSEFCSASVFG